MSDKSNGENENLNLSTEERLTLENFTLKEQSLNLQQQLLDQAKQTINADRARFFDTLTARGIPQDASIDILTGQVTVPPKPASAEA
jgi:hypothetical protein